MGRLRHIPLAVLSASAALGSHLAYAANTPTGQEIQSLEQSWFFDWTTAGSPVPVVEQCGVLDITWQRGAAKGPNPSAPYSMQIYTSTFVTPFVIDMGEGQEFQWTVPFIPDTTFQICMFDKNGNTGGCQRTMTVIRNYTDSSPTCQNLTYPRPDQVLNVQANDATGPSSQFGWPAQCTDLSFTPKNGSAPYTLTIAPTLHPPYNITVNSTGTTANWTVNQTWGSSFFVSMADSAGNAWSYGPMHAGQGDNDCLASSSTPKKKENTVSTYAAVGAGLGGAIGGLLVGLLSAFFIYRCARPQGPRITMHAPSRESVLIPGGVEPETVYTALPQLGGHPHSRTGSTASQTVGASSVGRRTEYEPWKVEPWVSPSELGSSLPGSPNQRNDAQPLGSPPPHLPTSPLQNVTTVETPPPVTQPRQSAAVYVVHHDGGRPPVSVYTDDGTQVVELPPRYVGEGNSSQPSGAAQPPPPIVQRRQPNVPSKGRMRTENPTSPADGSLSHHG